MSKIEHSPLTLTKALLFVLIWTLCPNYGSAQELLLQQGHVKKSYDLAIHPNGRWVATIENDIRIWDIYSRKLLRVFKDFDESQTMLSFSNNPNSKFLITTGEQENKVNLWNIETGKLVKTFNLGYNFLPSSLTWVGSKDDEPFFFFVMGYKEWRKYDIRKTNYIRSTTIKDEFLDGESNTSADAHGVRDLDMATKGKRLMIIPEINSILVRNFDALYIVPISRNSKKGLQKINLGSPVHYLDYCTATNHLAVATDDDFQLYDLADNSKLFSRPNQWTAYEHRIKLSDNGKYLFLDHYDSSTVIDWTTGKTILNLSSTVSVADFTLNDEYLVVGGWPSPFVFSLKNGARQDMDVLSKSVYGIELVDKKILHVKSYSSDTSKVYFDLENLEFIENYKVKTGARTCTWDMYKNSFTIYDKGKKVNDFQLDFEVNGIPISKVPYDDEKISSYAISADGKFIYALEIYVDPKAADVLKKANEKRGYNTYPTRGYKRRVAKYDATSGLLVKRSKALRKWAGYELQLINNGEHVLIKGQDVIKVLNSNNLKEVGDLSPPQPKNWFSPYDSPIFLSSKQMILVHQRGKLHFSSSVTFKHLKTIEAPFYFTGTNAVVFRDSFVAIGGTEGKQDLILIHLPTFEIVNWAKTSFQKIKSIELIEDVLILLYEDGSMKFWKITEWSAKSNFRIDRGTKEFLIYKRDGRFYGTKRILKHLTLTKGLNSFSISQFDQKYNKPHEVLKDLQFVKPSKVELMEKLYHKRLQQYENLKSVEIDRSPQIEVQRLPFDSYSATIDVKISCKSDFSTLEYLEVWANGVPVYGVQGLKLKGSKAMLDTTLTFDLLNGANEFKFSVRDKQLGQSAIEKRKVQSYRTKTRDSLIIISIATSNYENSDYDLKYAVKDGRDLIKTFNKINLEKIYTFGGVHNSYKYFLRTDTLFNEQVTRDNFQALVDKISNCRPQDKVIITMSGHGLLDDDLNWWFATHDMDFEKPETKGIGYKMIMDLLDRSPSRHKLLLLDACHSGELDKSSEMIEVSDDELPSQLVRQEFKGARVVKKKNPIGLDNSYELMKEHFLDMNSGTGVHVISAAAGDSYALESDQWNNGVFSYSVIQALLGTDKNIMKDGLTIYELQQFVAKNVESLTKGRQKPMTRSGSPQYDFVIW
jgi:hypothetical protein